MKKFLLKNYKMMMQKLKAMFLIFNIMIFNFNVVILPSGVAWAESGSDDLIVPQVYIKAVNPGYTVDGVSNVGEMIEISRRSSSDAPISLAGLKVSYTNSSGKTSLLFEFPEHSFLAGENFILRLASSPMSELANSTYTKTLAMKAGPLTLWYGDKVVDTVCWLGDAVVNADDETLGCAAAFKSASPTVLVRDGGLGGTSASGSSGGAGEVGSGARGLGDFLHVPVEAYEVKYDAENYYVERANDGPDDGYGAVAQCAGMVFSEILSYYAETKDEQFVEFYNNGTETVLLDGCFVRYKNKNYVLSGMVRPEEYVVAYPAKLGFALTKNPTNGNVLELVDADGSVVDTLTYPNGQRKGTAWAWVGYDADGERLWRTTYVATPGEANNYQEFKTCETGKVINAATGNCVKVTTVAEKICGEGQYLNVLTGRCRKIETASATTCKDGYYYYAETGRCRKIVENTGANYAVEMGAETYEEKSSFVALYAVLGVVGVGVLYVVWEFRKEIVRGGKWVVGKIKKK